MAMEIKLYSPAGTEYNISTPTNRVEGSDLGGLNLRVENDFCSYVVDDLTLTLHNQDGYFTSLWPLPLDPTLIYDETAGNGCWSLKLYKLGSLRFEGDLDPGSVEFNHKTGMVKTTWLGAAKRAGISAQNIKRITTDPIYFSNTRHGRKLTFWQEAGHTNHLNCSTLGIQEDDIIKANKLTQNAHLIDQELTIKVVGASADPVLASYEARIRQGCKRVYGEGRCITPFYKTTDSTTLTVADCVELILDEIGVPSGNQVISGTGTGIQVDEFVTEDKACNDLLRELSLISGCIWFRDTSTGKWYFIDRNSAKSVASAKDISALLDEVTVMGSNEEWIDNCLVKGTAPRFAPNSKPRQYRYGSGRKRPLEISTDFTSDMDVLQAMAEQAYASFGILRKKAQIRLLDDGTAYNIWDKVAFYGEDWLVLEVKEPLRGLEYKGMIELTVISVAGTTPSGAGHAIMYDADDDAPYPAEDVEVSSAKLSKRKSWWSDFRAVYPADEVPKKRSEKVEIEILGEDTVVYDQEYMLHALRFKWPYGGTGADLTEDAPDGFEITCCKEGEAPDNSDSVKRHKAIRNPKPDANGWYYAYFYKPITSAEDAVAWDIYIRVWVAGRDLSAYSDPANTDDAEDPGGGVDEMPPQVIMAINGSGAGNFPVLLRYTPELASWETLTAPDGYAWADPTGIKQVLYDRRNNRLYVYFQNDGSTDMYIGYSKDFGTTWEGVLSIPSDCSLSTTAHMFLSVDDGGLYLSVTRDKTPGTHVAYTELIYSSDPPSGQWSYGECAGDYPENVLGLFTISDPITVDPQNDQNVWIYTGDALLYNSNGGNSGTVKDGTCDVTHGTPSTILEKTGDTFSAGDVGKSFRLGSKSYLITGFTPGSPNALTVDPYDGTYPQTQTGASFKIYDWKAYRISISGTYKTPVKIIPGKTPGTLYALLNDGKTIIKSTDYGATWASLYAFASDINLAGFWESDASTAVLYAGGHTGDGSWCIWRSADSGSTFTKISGSLGSAGDDYTCYEIKGITGAAGTFVGYGEKIDATEGVFLFYTADGTTWSKTEPTGLYPASFINRSTWVQLMAIKDTTTAPPITPQNKLPIYLLCRNTTGGADEKRRIYRTRNNGTTFDKVWGDGTDIAATPHVQLVVEHGNNTRIYRLAEGDAAKFSDTSGIPSEIASLGSFGWYPLFLPPAGMSFWKAELDGASAILYLTDGHSIWRVMDRLSASFTYGAAYPPPESQWMRILSWGSVEADRCYSLATDKDTGELFSVHKNGDIKYCSNPWYDEGANTWSAGIASGFGSGEAVDILVTATMVYVVGNNASFKIRAASKADIITEAGGGSAATWSTITAPTGIGDLEPGGLFIDDDDKDVALVMSRNSTAGLWGCNDLTTSATWGTAISSSAYRVACKISGLTTTYMVAGNGVVSKARLAGGSWSLQSTGISDAVENLADKHFMAIGTQRTYFPSTGGGG